MRLLLPRTRRASPRRDQPARYLYRACRHPRDHPAAGAGRGVPFYAVQQREGGWFGDWNPESVLDLPHSTVLVVGVGAIGTEVARLLRPFGPRLIGTDARREDPGPLHELHRPEALDELLPRADATVLALPHTPATDGLIDRRRLALMRGFLVNVGRGPLVRTDDLVDALRDSRLRGAGPDVVDPEPLPREHPLRAMPNVLITPHIAGVGPGTDELRYGLLLDNARRLAEGEPLRNVVDKAAWY
ncbi:MAG TPA: NAD(P)-dependent oxidoreductase [Jatrophihabitantaceae bacterium]